jgi:hypothetical protein
MINPNVAVATHLKSEDIIHHFENSESVATDERYST